MPYALPARMTSPDVIQALNDLLRAEAMNLAPRLIESAVYASPTSVRLLEMVRTMAHASRRAGKQITDLILDLDGQPGPRPCVTATAGFHFQEICALYAQLLQSSERLVAVYRAIVPRLSGSAEAAALGNRLMAEHERELAQLRAVKPVLPAAH